MKKILFLFFLLISFSSNAQCDFTLDEFLNLMVSNSSEYETKILKKGYDYDSTRETYFCDIRKQPFRITKRFQLENFYGFHYSTFRNLDIKKRIVEMKFTFSKEVPIQNTKGLLYIANNIHITLFTQTINLIPNYNILIQMNLLETE
jgi:hypothetical protein